MPNDAPNAVSATPAVEPAAVTPAAPTAAPAAEVPAAVPASTTPAVVDATKPADAPKPAEAKPGEVKPAEAVYDIKPPEGVVLDPVVVGKLTDFAKANNLSPEVAQKLVDEMSPNLQAQQMANFETIRAGWVETSKTDKEIGGVNFETNLATAKGALEKFGTPELKAFLNTSKLGDHPEMVRAWARVGKAMSEDTFIQGGERPAANKNDARRFYPNSNHSQ